jgi:hypothetical protein
MDVNIGRKNIKEQYKLKIHGTEYLVHYNWCYMPGRGCGRGQIYFCRQHQKTT